MSTKSEAIIVRCPSCGTQNRIPQIKLHDTPRCGKCHALLNKETVNAHPVQLTDATFEREVLRHQGTVLVDFWAPWCGPCRMVAPVLEELARDYAGTCRIAKVNVDENQATASRYGIRSIPTLLLFKDGKLVDTMVGALPKQELARRIKNV